MCQRDDVDMYIYRNLKISTIFEKEIFSIFLLRSIFLTRLRNYTKFSLSSRNNFSEKDIDNFQFYKLFSILPYYPISITKFLILKIISLHLSKIYSRISHSQLKKRGQETLNTIQLANFSSARSQWRKRASDVRRGDNLQSVGQIIPYNVFTLSSFDSGKRRGNRATAVGRHCLPIP